MFQLSISLQARMIQSLQVCGGATSTIFPQVEAVLIDSVEYQKALEFIASKKDMSRYESVMDFFFCEIFDKYQYACFKYYENSDCPRLIDIISVEELVSYNNTLLKALDIAHDILKEKRRLSWMKFRFEILEIAA